MDAWNSCRDTRPPAWTRELHVSGSLEGMQSSFFPANSVPAEPFIGVYPRLFLCDSFLCVGSWNASWFGVGNLRCIKDMYSSGTPLVIINILLRPSSALLSSCSPEADFKTKMWVCVVFLELIPGNNSREWGSETRKERWSSKQIKKERKRKKNGTEKKILPKLLLQENRSFTHKGSLCQGRPFYFANWWNSWHHSRIPLWATQFNLAGGPRIQCRTHTSEFSLQGVRELGYLYTTSISHGLGAVPRGVNDLACPACPSHRKSSPHVWRQPSGKRVQVLAVGSWVTVDEGRKASTDSHC